MTENQRQSWLARITSTFYRLPGLPPYLPHYLPPYLHSLPLVVAALLLYAPSFHADARLTMALCAAIAFLATSWLIWRYMLHKLGFWPAALFSCGLLVFALVDFSISLLTGLHANLFLLSMLIEGGPFGDSGWLIITALCAAMSALMMLCAGLRRLITLPQGMPRWRIALLIAISAMGGAQISYIEGFLTGDPKVLTSAQDMALFWTPHPYRMRQLASLVGGAEHDNAFSTASHAADLPSAQPRQLDVTSSASNTAHPDIAFIITDSLRTDPQYPGAMISHTNLPHTHAAIIAASNCTHFSFYSIYFGDNALGFAPARANRTQQSASPLVRGLSAKGYDQQSFESHNLNWYDTADIIFGDQVPRTIANGSSAATRDRNALDAAFTYLNAPEARPKFAHIYLYGTHFPYGSPVDGSSLRQRYRAATDILSTSLSDFARKLQASGFFDNGLLVFTSDHGEEFADDPGNRAGLTGHTSRLSDAQIIVPLEIIGLANVFDLPRWHGELAHFLLNMGGAPYRPEYDDRQPVIIANCGYHWPRGLAAVWPTFNRAEPVVKIPFRLDRGALLPAPHPDGRPLTRAAYQRGLAHILPATKRLRRY